MTYISTQSFTSPLRQSVLQIQSALAQAQNEVSTGAPDDLGLALGARTGTSLSMKIEIDSLNGYSSANSVAATRLSSTDAALSSLLTSAQGMSAALLTASSSGGLTTSVQTSAKAALQSLISGLNTTAGGQSIFGGINTDATPVADYFSATTSSAKGAVNSAFSQAFGTSQTSDAAGAITADQMNTFLDGKFDAMFTTSAWQANWSSASNATISTQISATQSATTSVSANEAAFRQIAEAYTMVSEFTGANLSDDTRKAVIAKASTLMASGIAALTNIQSGVGVTQSAMSDAATRISAQVTTLKSNVSDMESIDPYALSSQISTLQTQLQASYQLTASLQKLSLVNYLG